LRDLIKKQNINKDIKVLIEFQDIKNNNKEKAVLTITQDDIDFINTIVPKGEEKWSKSRIAVTGCGILVVLLGILYGYMNHHNLTFSNVLHAYY